MGNPAKCVCGEWFDGSNIDECRAHSGCAIRSPGLTYYGTSRPDDTYCYCCDVFGHARGSPACEEMNK